MLYDHTTAQMGKELIYYEKARPDAIVQGKVQSKGYTTQRRKTKRVRTSHNESDRVMTESGGVRSKDTPRGKLFLPSAALVLSHSSLVPMYCRL